MLNLRMYLRPTRLMGLTDLCMGAIGLPALFTYAPIRIAILYFKYSLRWINYNVDDASAPPREGEHGKKERKGGNFSFLFFV